MYLEGIHRWVPLKQALRFVSPVRLYIFVSAYTIKQPKRWLLKRVQDIPVLIYKWLNEFATSLIYMIYNNKFDLGEVCKTKYDVRRTLLQ